MFRVINKFAFLIHEPVLCDHWKGIWRLLDPSEFVILLTDDFRNADDPVFRRNGDRLTGILGSHGYQYRYVNDVIREKVKYAFVISNHYVSGSTLVDHPWYRKALRIAIVRLANVGYRLRGREGLPASHWAQYLSLRCGITPVRIMYGADISAGWSLARWNEQYKVIFCHGPNDEDIIRARFQAETYQMGYPRYDSYFNDSSIHINNPLLEEFGFSRERRTVVWLPTFGDGVCSIRWYAKQIAGLKARYNVLVRPHPISFRKAPGDIRILEDLNLRIDSDDVRDMNYLYAAADFVVCDYGGTAFSALYLDKNIVQLDVPGADTFYTSSGSSNLELRELLSPVIRSPDAGNLQQVLEDDSVWARQAEQREKAFQKYFAPYRGKSADRVVSVLRSLSGQAYPPG